MIEQLTRLRERGRGLGAIWLLLLLAVLAAPFDASAGGPEWVIDSTMLPLMGLPRGDEVVTLVGFGMEGRGTDTVLTLADVYGPTRNGWRSTRMGNWQLRWRRPGYEDFLLSAEGYRPIRLDSLRLPYDSMVVVTATLQPGTDTMSRDAALDCCLSIKYRSLDTLVPHNAIVGTVTDDSLGIPVDGARVYCEDTKEFIETDSSGRFTATLGRRLKATLHVWHPLYDSIRFEVKKNYMRTQKPIQIHFESMREFPPDRLRYTDSSALLISTWTNWSSWGVGAREDKVEVYTHAVKAGEVFGPTSSWVMGDCLPLRLVKSFRDRRSWVQFTRDLGPIGERYDWPTNLIDVTDTAAELSTHTLDAGCTVTLQLQPDYTPRGSVFQDWRNRRTAAGRRTVSEKTPCDSIRADVERLHLQNLLYFLTGDFERLVAAYSADFRVRGDEFTPSVQFYERVLSHERMKEVLSSRMAELFDFRRAEVYVNGVCDEPMNDQYLKAMNEADFEPAAGDVYITFKKASRSPWGRGWTAIYRKEDGQWKILTTF